MKVADTSRNPGSGQPMASHRPPKICPVYTPRHHSCLTEIPKLHCIKAFLFSSEEEWAIAWHGLTKPLPFFPLYRRAKALLRGRNQDAAPQELSSNLPPSLLLAEGGI
jgi:hypothetical protein